MPFAAGLNRRPRCLRVVSRLWFQMLLPFGLMLQFGSFESFVLVVRFDQSLVPDVVWFVGVVFGFRLPDIVLVWKGSRF